MCTRSVLSVSSLFLLCSLPGRKARSRPAPLDRAAPSWVEQARARTPRSAERSRDGAHGPRAGTSPGSRSSEDGPPCRWRESLFGGISHPLVRLAVPSSISLLGRTNNPDLSCVQPRVPPLRPPSSEANPQPTTMPLLAAVEPALPAAELDQILREGLGPLLMGSYGTVCLFTFECLFMCQVSLS